MDSEVTDQEPIPENSKDSKIPQPSIHLFILVFIAGALIGHFSDLILNATQTEKDRVDYLVNLMLENQLEPFDKRTLHSVIEKLLETDYVQDRDSVIFKILTETQKKDTNSQLMPICNKKIVIGFVLDSDGFPIELATVEIDTMTEFSDSRGFFKFFLLNVPVSENQLMEIDSYFEKRDTKPS